MKIDTETVSVQSNFNGRSRRVTIDPESIGDIMDSLSGLYSNIFRALIRELSTNALDSHIAAGIKKPIEVNLPTRFNNELVIRDYGLGLDADDIDRMFVYGSSTKKESNDFTGRLGYGSKSPWAYTHTFSLTGVKDGFKTLALLTKDEDGVGLVQILDVSPTDEPNGAQVSIPVKPGDEYQFEREATYMFTYWPQDSVRINGKPTRGFEFDIQISDRIFLVRESGGNDVVVMGGVPYMVRGEDRLFQRNVNYRNYSVVVFAENGDIRFTPSREAIKYNHAKTMEKLKFWHEEVESKFAEKISQEIASCATYNDAAKKAASYSHFNLNLTYNDQIIPDHVNGTSFYPGSIYYNKNIYLAWKHEGVVITNFTGKKVSKQQRMKIEKHTGATSGYFLDTADTIWFDHLKHYDWSDIVKEKLNLPKPGKREVTWGVLTYRGVEEKKELKDNVAFVEVDEKPSRDCLSRWSDADCDIVVLRKKYAAEFKKLYPNALSVTDYAKAELSKYEAKAQSTVTYSYTNYVMLKSLAYYTIDDPAIKEHIAKALAMTDVPSYYNSRINCPRWVTDLAGYSYNLDMAIVDPFEDYPLIRNLDQATDDVVLYVNAKYNQTKGN